MDYKEIAAALEELRTTTDHLVSVDVEQAERPRFEDALVQRQIAIENVQKLVDSQPEAFTVTDLEQIGLNQSKGKRVLEHLLVERQSKWKASTEMAMRSHLLGSFRRPDLILDTK